MIVTHLDALRTMVFDLAITIGWQVVSSASSILFITPTFGIILHGFYVVGDRTLLSNIIHMTYDQSCLIRKDSKEFPS